MLDMLYDVFICHASEDKEAFVRPLAAILQESHLEVWYDEFALSVGDSVRRAIDRGLAQSRYGIVVLSPSFFAKNRLWMFPIVSASSPCASVAAPSASFQIPSLAPFEETYSR